MTYSKIEVHYFGLFPVFFETFKAVLLCVPDFIFSPVLNNRTCNYVRLFPEFRCRRVRGFPAVHSFCSNNIFGFCKMTFGNFSTVSIRTLVFFVMIYRT
jgi:hypothetical protein